MCMEVKYKTNMRVNMKRQLAFAFEELICYEIKCSLSSSLFLVRQCVSCLNGRAATALTPLLEGPHWPQACCWKHEEPA